MDVLTIKGTLTKALEKRGGVGQSGSAWAVQSFRVDYMSGEEQKFHVFEVFGEDNINQFLTTHQIGSGVEVRCALNCREWNGKYFYSLRYLTPKNEQMQTAPAQTPVQPQMAQPMQQTAQAPFVRQQYAQPTQNAVQQPKMQQTNNDQLPF